MAFGGLFNRSGTTSWPTLPAAAVDLPSDNTAEQTAIVAGGCFWCIDGVFRQLKGVIEVTSGYAGGSKATADYKAVCTGDTGHAEAVRVKYDPAQITYARLLQVFFTAHDPTTKDRQGHDVGTQYRSAIFVLDPEQERVARAYIEQLNSAKIFPGPVVTTVEPLEADRFYPAEAYHQDYAACHLGNPYIQQESLPKIARVRQVFGDALK